MYKVSIGNAFGHSIYTDLCMNEMAEGVHTAFDRIDSIFTEYAVSLNSPENLEAELFGEAADEKSVSPKFVERLGAAIRALVSEIGKFIEKIGEAFMTNDAKLRKQQEELERQINADPDLKKKVMTLSAAGAINLRDMKDINELCSEVDKLMEEKNPTTLKGKLDKIKKEWDDPNGKFLKKIAGATAVVGLAAAIFKLSPQLKDAKDNLTLKSKENQKELQKMGNYFQYYNKTVKGKTSTIDIRKMNDMQTRLALAKFKQGRIEEAANIALHNHKELSKGTAILARLAGGGKKIVPKSKSELQRAVGNRGQQVASNIINGAKK